MCPPAVRRWLRPPAVRGLGGRCSVAGGGAAQSLLLSLVNFVISTPNDANPVLRDIHVFNSHTASYVGISTFISAIPRNIVYIHRLI